MALEALRGDRTAREIAAKHKVHPTQATTWKRQAIDGLTGYFPIRSGGPKLTKLRSKSFTPRSEIWRSKTIFFTRCQSAVNPDPYRSARVAGSMRCSLHTAQPYRASGV
ncbi:hypothetical protein J7354_15820 [Sulfitobacter sp. R18_2]|nr:hypothetical protein [Sulfitobacter sp. R18_2]